MVYQGPKPPPSFYNRAERPYEERGQHNRKQPNILTPTGYGSTSANSLHQHHLDQSDHSQHSQNSGHSG